jgi:hypothetical protein
MFRMSTSLSLLQILVVAPLTLLASAGGVAAASKRQFLLSGCCTVVSTCLLHGSNWEVELRAESGIRRGV